MRSFGIGLERLGKVLMCGGGVFSLGVLLWVSTNGSWPQFLEPFRSQFETDNYSLDPLALVLGFAVVFAPGFLLVLAGNEIQSRFSDRHHKHTR